MTTPQIPLRQPVKPPVMAPMSAWRWLKAWLGTLFVDHSLFRFFYNLRSPVGRDLFRSGHPMPYQIRAAHKAGIRSIVNLRGAETDIGSNLLEWQTCAELGLPMVHFQMGSREAPFREAILGLDQLLDTLPKPILVHCKSGADRAGLVSAMYLLLKENAPYEQAIQQMEFWRHGHVRQAKTGILDHFLETYRAHHQAHGTGFRDWVTNHYDRAAVDKSFHASWWANHLVDRILRRE